MLLNVKRKREVKVFVGSITTGKENTATREVARNIMQTYRQKKGL